MIPPCRFDVRMDGSIEFDGNAGYGLVSESNSAWHNDRRIDSSSIAFCLVISVRVAQAEAFDCVAAQ